ncbi:MAG: hypothetical protein HYU88_05445 [Chloroflexi bacterium]|nr:hypothetical protein [Chloroflexota bacterium]
MRRQTLWLLSLTALLLATLIGGLAAADIASADRDHGGRGERGRGNDDHPRGRPAHIAWEQREVEIALAPGETKTIVVNFTASQDIAHATLDVRPGRATLDAAPGDLGAVRAGQSYSVTLTAHLPADERRPHRRAQLFVHDGQRTLAPPLRVDIRNTAAKERDEDEDDGEDGPAHLSWTPSLVLGSVTAGGTFSATASFVSDRALDDARVRVRTLFGLDLDVEPKELGDIAANQAVTLTLTARAPIAPTLPVLLGRVQIVADDAQVGPLLWVLLHVTPAPAADQTAPVVTASQSPEANVNGWNNADVQVTLAASDNEGGSGVAAIHYRVNEGAEVVVSGATAAITVSAEGATTIPLRAVDGAR